MSDKNEPQPSTSKIHESPKSAEIVTVTDVEENELPGVLPLDDSLDFANENFDPLKALYAPELVVSSKKIYENFATFESAMRKLGIYGMSSKKKPTTEKSEPEPERPREAFDIDDSNAQRRFLPHQMAIRTGGLQKKKNTRDINATMDEITGPLSLLRKSMEEHLKVKVYTRSLHNIRGYTTGYVIAFDRQWNILLEEASETWKRRKFKYGENKTIGTPMDCSERLQSLGISLPASRVKSLNRKNVEITRHIGQLMIRGEQIALIVMLKEEVGHQSAESTGKEGES